MLSWAVRKVCHVQRRPGDHATSKSSTGIAAHSDDFGVSVLMLGRTTNESMKRKNRNLDLLRYRRDFRHTDDIRCTQLYSRLSNENIRTMLQNRKVRETLFNMFRLPKLCAQEFCTSTRGQTGGIKKSSRCIQGLLNCTA